jgi:SAM-dependent methyltransferase
MERDGAVDRSDPAYAGQAAYTPTLLRVYDLAMYRFNLPVLWRCSRQQLVDLYDRQVSGRHLDIGVATGALLDQCRFPVSSPEITLMDLNPNTLEFAARRVKRYAPRVHQANVLQEWGLPAGRFDSVAMMNLLHCVPGTIKEKAVAFDHASSTLSPGGVLFGSTVLGRGVRHTRRSNAAMRRLNGKGQFCNAEDSLDDLDAALAERFPSHNIELQGVVALFVAKTQS